MAYEIKEAKEKVIRAGKELLRTGLIARTWGNISARISDTQFVITPSGRGYDSLTPDDIVAVNIADGSYEGNIRPSSEKGVHAAAYRHRKDADFVIHTHQDYATDLSTLRRTWDVASMDPDAVRILGPEIPTADYGMSGTKEITDNVESAIAEHPADKSVLMQNHGTLCIGDNVEDAFAVAHTLERVCRAEYFRILGELVPDRVREEGYSLSSFSRVYRRGGAEYRPVFDQHPDIQCIIETDAPYVRQYGRCGKPLIPYVDDLAMIVGMDIPALPEDASESEISRAVTGTDSAILVGGRGAVCTAGNEEDAGAVVMILDKGCQMGLLELAGAHPVPVSPENGNYEHRFYVEQYSKRK